MKGSDGERTALADNCKMESEKSQRGFALLSVVGSGPIPRQICIIIVFLDFILGEY